MCKIIKVSRAWFKFLHIQSTLLSCLNPRGLQKLSLENLKEQTVLLVPAGFGSGESRFSYLILAIVLLDRLESVEERKMNNNNNNKTNVTELVKRLTLSLRILLSFSPWYIQLQTHTTLLGISMIIFNIWEYPVTLVNLMSVETSPLNSMQIDWIITFQCVFIYNISSFWHFKNDLILWSNQDSNAKILLGRKGIVHDVFSAKTHKKGNRLFSAASMISCVNKENHWVWDLFH